MKKDSKKRGRVLPPPPIPKPPSRKLLPPPLTPPRGVSAPSQHPALAPAHPLPPALAPKAIVAPAPRVSKPLTAPIAPLKESPPLFIKIDKYSDVVKNIQRLKSYALSLRDALDALADIENELKTGLSITQKALDKFNTIITMLDSRLLRVQGTEKEETKDIELSVQSPGEIDDYVKKMYDQMEKIKNELTTIS